MKIIAKPLAGLANKLRVIESALSLARDLHYPVEIVWTPDWQMVAHYRDLLEPNELFKVTDHDKYKYCRSSFSLKGYKKPMSRVINFLYGVDIAFSEIDIFKQVRSGQYEVRSYAINRRTYIDTCHYFYPYHYRFSWVKPLPQIAAKVDAFLQSLRGRACIGLHIRRTDNISSIENSPDELFESAILEEIEMDEEAIFFLATDDEGTEKHFIGLFGSDRIRVHPKKFGRDSVEAVQDALVDWLILSRCKKLYCSYFSSFSETAAAVTNAPAVTLTRKKAAP